MHRVGLTRAKLLFEPQPLTPISGIQNCKRTLLEDACRVVFLCELWDCPVINALVVPWFVFFMLQLVKTCSKSWRWRGSQQPQCGQNGDAHFALLLRRPSVSGLLRLFLRAHHLVVVPMSICFLVVFNCAAASGCRTASQTSWCSVTTS